MKRDLANFNKLKDWDEYGGFLKRWTSAEHAWSWVETASTNDESEGLGYTDGRVLSDSGPDVLEAACNAPLPMSPFWDEELGYVPYTPIDFFVSSEERWAAACSLAAENLEYTPRSPSIYAGLTEEELWAAACSPPAEDLEYTPRSPSICSGLTQEERLAADCSPPTVTAEYTPCSPSVYSREVNEQTWTTACSSPVEETGRKPTPCDPTQWGAESLEDPWTLHTREAKIKKAALENGDWDAKAEPWNPPDVCDPWSRDLKASSTISEDSKDESADFSESEDDSTTNGDSTTRTTTTASAPPKVYSYSPPTEEPHTNSESGREWKIKDKSKRKRKGSALTAETPSTPSTSGDSTSTAKKQRIRSRLLSAAFSVKTQWQKAQSKSADLTPVSEITKKWLKDIICDPARETSKPWEVDSEEQLAPVHPKLFQDFCGEDFSRPWASKPRTVHIGSDGEELVEEASAPPKGFTWEGLREEQDLKAERFQERLSAKGSKAVKRSLSWGLLGVSEYRRFRSGSDV